MMVGEVDHLEMSKQEPSDYEALLLTVPASCGLTRGYLHAISLGFDAVNDVPPQLWVL